jgi:hypothetical protein
VGEQPGKHLLRQVFGAMLVPRKAGAKALDGGLPPTDQRAEGRGVIVSLHAPHQLLVAGGEEIADGLEHGNAHRRAVAVAGIGIK